MCWRDTVDGVYWSDGGAIELAMVDGTVVLADLAVHEFFTSEEELPVPIATAINGDSLHFYSFDRWRYVIEKKLD